MKKRSAFKHLYEYSEAKSILIEDMDADDIMLSLLTDEDLRALRDPTSAEALQILKLLKSSIH